MKIILCVFFCVCVCKKSREKEDGKKIHQKRAVILWVEELEIIFIVFFFEFRMSYIDNTLCVTKRENYCFKTVPENQ